MRQCCCAFPQARACAHSRDRRTGQDVVAGGVSALSSRARHWQSRLRFGTRPARSGGLKRRDGTHFRRLISLNCQDRAYFCLRLCRLLVAESFIHPGRSRTDRTRSRGRLTIHLPSVGVVTAEATADYAHRVWDQCPARTNIYSYSFLKRQTKGRDHDKRPRPAFANAGPTSPNDR